MRPLGRGGRGDGGLDVVARGRLVAVDPEGDERRATVAGDRARRAGSDQVADVRRGAEAGDEVARGDLEGRVAGDDAGASLDEHLLERGLREVRLVVRAQGAARLAVAHLRHGEVALADGAADREGDEHEAQPTPDRDAAAPGAPAACGGRDVHADAWKHDDLLVGSPCTIAACARAAIGSPRQSVRGAPAVLRAGIGGAAESYEPAEG